MLEGNKYNKKKKREREQAKDFRNSVGELIRVGLIEQRGGVGEGLDLAGI